MELKVDRYGQIPSTLHFNKPSSSLATRCDVIYKTLLRDCRKFYTDQVQFKNSKKGTKQSQISGNLDSYVDTYFAEYDEDTRVEIKFYLGCFTYPKHLVSTKSEVVVSSEEGKLAKVRRNKKVKELHTFLYVFSMEKCERFFNDRIL